MAENKTEWAKFELVFLGLLLDFWNRQLTVPIQKVNKARFMITRILNHKPCKSTPREMEEICGFLNFLGKAIVPGRALTRRLYCLTSTEERKSHHHFKIKAEFQADLERGLSFINSQQIYSRPFFKFNKDLVFDNLDFATDTIANRLLGCGGVNGQDYFILQWEDIFIKTCKPSINYLESVMHMVNKNTSSCGNCMVLIRLIVLKMLEYNVKIKVEYINTKQNYFADMLSRLKIQGILAESKRRKKTIWKANGSTGIFMANGQTLEKKPKFTI